MDTYYLQGGETSTGTTEVDWVLQGPLLKTVTELEQSVHVLCFRLKVGLLLDPLASCLRYQNMTENHLLSKHLFTQEALMALHGSALMSRSTCRPAEK